MTALVLPTYLEASIIVDSLRNGRSVTLQGKEFITGNLHGKGMVLCICGIGKANAAHATALLCERFRPELIYVAGVAGAYPAADLDIGDIALALEEAYGDEGLMLSSGIMTMDELGLPLAETETGTYHNLFPMRIPEALNNYPHRGCFVTVSACTGSEAAGMALAERFGAICENMEGAAVAHVGLLNSIDVTEIRGISNIIEDREGSPLNKKALILAAENAQKFLLENILFED